MLPQLGVGDDFVVLHVFSAYYNNYFKFCGQLKFYYFCNCPTVENRSVADPDTGPCVFFFPTWEKIRLRGVLFLRLRIRVPVCF
jgi:hypothetical protein